MSNDKYIKKMGQLYDLAIKQEDTELAFAILSELKAQADQNHISQD